jgi:hypothetical protein
MADSTATLLWRWLSGMPLDGRYRTNATWLRPSHGAHATLHPVDVVRWHHLPRLHRAGIRTAATLITLWVAVGLLVYRTAMLGVLAAAGLVLGGAGGWWGYGRLRTWRHHRDWVNPLNDELPPDVSVKELALDRSRAVLALPGGVTGEQDQKQIVQIVAAKLNYPVAALEAAWKLHGKHPEVTVTLTPAPPGYVSFADIRELADAAAEHEAVLGLGRKDVPFVFSVENQSPHAGLSMSSGDGKSVTTRNVSCQLAHHGSLIACLDPKMMSQHWAAGLPNVAYARTPEEIHALAIWLAGEVDRRNLVALHSADVEGEVHANVGPRIIGILEELNVTQHELAAYWKSIDGRGRSPAVAALDKVSNTGRQVRINLLYIGQRLSAKATGGGSGDSRENLGVLLMSNPAASTWRMLVGDRHALPAATDVTGRLQVVTAKTVTEVQGAYVTGAQAREYATSGVVAVPRDDMPCVGGLAPVGTPERAVADVQDMPAIGGHAPGLHIVRDIPVRPQLPPRITIKQAIAEGISGPTEEAVRKQLRPDRQRPGVTPPQKAGTRGNADEYDRTEWCDWEEARRQPRRLARR